MSISSTQKAITYLEAVVTIFIIAVLISIAIPAFTTVAIRSPQAKALNNAKTIGLSCTEYAIDHNGQYPSFILINGTTSKTRISDYSNTAFDQLFPDYLGTIQIFYQPKSAWTPTKFDDPSPATMAVGKSLPAGSNEWAYVAGLRNTSDSRLPLIADGFADLKTHAYTTDEKAKGGVWKGGSPIIVFCDTSARVMKCDPSTHRIPGSPNGADLFDTSGQPGWMSSTGTNAQIVLNPQ